MNNSNNGIGCVLNYSAIMKMIRILGLMAVISYMVVILFTWVYANIKGYVYFSAGEPELLIKYSEWALGALGILAAIDYLRKEINDEISYNNKTQMLAGQDISKPYILLKQATHKTGNNKSHVMSADR
ncbi:MAG TPA: hypothetical protein VIO11_01595 [Candidatus Methanoperedens sp.]